MVPEWQRPGPLDGQPIATTVFYTLDTVAICCNLFTMCLSTFCMIKGPNLAIRGPSGSMGRAVAGMYAERTWALRSFWAGNGFIMLACIALGWMKFETPIAWALTVILFGFIGVLAYYINYITRPRFRLPTNTVNKKPVAEDPDEQKTPEYKNYIGDIEMDKRA